MKKIDTSISRKTLVTWAIKKLAPLADPNERLIIKISLFIFFTGLPVIIFNAISGTLTGTNINTPFLNEIEIIVHLFVIIPFLLFAERLIEQPLIDYLKRTTELIYKSDQDKLVKFKKTFINLLKSSFPELIILLILYILTLFRITNVEFETSSWFFQNQSIGNEQHLSMAGWWFTFVSLPLYQFLFIRWFWRWLLWLGSIMYFSRLKWKLHAMHGDKMAGLEYLNYLPFMFSVCAASIALNLSVEIFVELREGQTTLLDYKLIVAGFVFITTMICYLPLIFFLPKLSQLRSEAIIKFGTLIQYHHNYFEKKWFSKPEPEVEEILGSTHPSSMGDINASYEAVQAMRAIPINYKYIMISAFILTLPFLPLLSTMFSIKELFDMIIKTLI